MKSMKGLIGKPNFVACEALHPLVTSQVAGRDGRSLKGSGQCSPSAPHRTPRGLVRLKGVISHDGALEHGQEITFLFPYMRGKSLWPNMRNTHTHCYTHSIHIYTVFIHSSNSPFYELYAVNSIQYKRTENSFI